MLYRLVFERPVLLTALSVGAEFLLVLLWARWRGRNLGRATCIGLIIIPCLVAVSLLVVTPAEQIVAVCRSLARAVDEGDMPAIGAKVAHDFESAGLDKTELLSRIERTLMRVRVDHPRLSGFEIDLAGDYVGVATFGAMCRVRSAEFGSGYVPSRWRLKFRRAGNAWLVTSIESLPVPPLNVRNLSDWLR